MARKTSVLIVDDDESMLEYCDAILICLGYEAATASTGRQALAMLATRSFDIVLTDHITVGSQAVPMHKAAMGVQPEAQVIIMSGIPTLVEAAASYLSGARAYLAKPFDLGELKDALEKCQPRCVS